MEVPRPACFHHSGVRDWVEGHADLHLAEVDHVAADRRRYFVDSEHTKGVDQIHYGALEYVVHSEVIVGLQLVVEDLLGQVTFGETNLHLFVDARVHGVPALDYVKANQVVLGEMQGMVVKRYAAILL